MISIAYCIHNLTMGGAERHLLQVFKELDRSRFHPVLICLGNSRNTLLYQEYESLGIEVIDLCLEGRLYAPLNLKKLLSMKKILARRNIKVVHGYLFEGNLVAALIGRLARVPVVIASKRSFDRYTNLPLLTCRLGNHLADCVTANSESVSDFVQSVESCPKRKLVVIHNGVNGSGDNHYSERARQKLRQNWNIPADSFVVGTVARFFWKKGYEHFVQMASLVISVRPNTQFVTIGDGPLKPQMEKMAEDFGIAGHIRFLGWQPNADRLLGLFDLYVCPSLMEGMSNALLEAGARGLPMIATAVGGNKETVVHGQTGFLVPPKDPAAMAEAVTELMDNPILLKQMGKRAKESINSKYSTAVMVRKMEGLYDSLLNQAGISS